MTNATISYESLVRIHDAAAMLGGSQSTLCAYERAGLIPPAMQNRAGQRVYTPHDLVAIRAVIVPIQKGE